MTAWWNRKWGKGSVCSITFSRLRPGKDDYGYKKCVYLSCKHGFYRKALVEWYKSCPKEAPTCPTCRRPFATDCLFR